LLYAIEHKIVIVAYPPHCTHALQGLDVVCFARVKVLWGEKLHILELNGIPMTKANFLENYGDVRLQAITHDNAIASFRATGIWPFNPEVITADQLAPSLATSTETTAPLPLPAELLDVREAFKMGRVRREEGGESVLRDVTNQTQPSTPIRQISTHIQRAVAGTEYEYIMDPHSTSFSSSTPVPNIIQSPHHHRDPQHPSFVPPPPIDPRLLSPSAVLELYESNQKRLAYLEGKVDSLESNLFLVHQYAGAAQTKLYHKEQKPPTRREKLAAGGKRDMTSDEWIEALRDEEDSKKTTEELKAGYKQWRDAETKARKEGDLQIDKEWLEYKKPFAELKKRPPKRKPAHITREETPERFWPIRKKRKVVVEDEGDDSGEGSEDDQN
jgi:hypothetical protein